MTTTVTRTIINQGPGNFVIQLLIQSDGTDGELVNYPIFDPVSDADPIVNPWFPAIFRASLMQGWNSQAWFDLIVSYNALEPTPIWVFARDSDHYKDFRFFGGLLDRSGAQRDGDILISTSGLTGAISIGTFVFAFKKGQP